MDKEKTHYANLIRYIIEHGGSASQDELDEIAAAKNPKNKDHKPNAAWYLKKKSNGKDKRNYGKYFTQNQDGKWSVTDKGKEYYDKYIKPSTKFSNTHARTISDDAIKIDNLDIVKFLTSSHNIILHGAPGTGKTFLAQAIAREVCNIDKNDKVENSPQFEMVQFHPSYDYTDFVEGLRPKSDGNGNIVFERTDGIFKAFCKKALKNLNNSTQSDDEFIREQKIRAAYQELIDKVRNEELTHINQRTTANVATFDHISDYDSIIFKRPSDGKPSANVVSLNRILALSQKYPDMASLDNMKNTTDEIRKAIGGCNCTWYWATLRYLYEMIEKGDDNTTENIKKDTRKNFVFLIDEINRGDMSKIFGELFFSIDPGYRGVDGKINTQYQNMLESSGDEFEKGFYIPENVYIIGTMNDIDRSVESMDFAMRRRFQFIEITAEDRAQGMKLYKETEAYKRMTNLNNCIISEDIGLSTAYQIGGAYFLKKVDSESMPITSDAEFKDLWEYRLKGLLREYLRGEDDKTIKDKIEKLRKAFELTRLYEFKDDKWVITEK